MKKLIAPTLMLLAVPILVSAQNADHQSRGLGYVFIGAGTHQMGLTTGFGGEGYVYRGLGIGAEVATAGWLAQAFRSLRSSLGARRLSIHSLSRTETSDEQTVPPSKIEFQAGWTPG